MGKDELFMKEGVYLSPQGDIAIVRVTPNVFFPYKVTIAGPTITFMRSHDFKILFGHWIYLGVL